MNQEDYNFTGSANMTVRLEYVWLDGHTTKNIRSKVRYDTWILNSESGQMDRDDVLSKCVDWNFDGSSTNQADTKNSDVVLRPVKVYHNPLEMTDMASFLILCETYNTDGTPHKTNSRAKLEKLLSTNDEDMWFAIEQEYTLIDNNIHTPNEVVGWNESTPQGENYCGVGSKNVNHRLMSDQHALLCMQAGIDVVGTNAEVLISQWEYQLGPKDALTTADDLWMSRYILHRLTEGNNFYASFEPKPIEGEWNGAGAHINFSTEYMRNSSDKEYIINVCESLSVTHPEHIDVYGEHNEKRLTGNCETQNINKFTYGVGDRGASIRIPQTTADDWSGYIEDRRPAANVDPYEALPAIINTVSLVKIPNTVEI